MNNLNIMKGCFVDDYYNGGCVFDGDDGMTIEDCTVAIKLLAESSGRDDCQYWRDYLICPDCGHIFSEGGEPNEQARN